MDRNSTERLSQRVWQAGTDQGPRPGNFAIGSLESRAAARAFLCVKLAGEHRPRLRLVVKHIGQPFNLEVSTCACALWPDGTVAEFVSLKGSDATEAQWENLEKAIRKIPIDGKAYTCGGVKRGI
jgi:hypothetical protein